MRATTYSTAALAMLSSFWSPVSGVAVGQDSNSDAFGGKQHAHTLVHIDITNGVPTAPPVYGFPNSNSTDVAGRRNVDYCIASAAQTGNCIQAAAFLSAIGIGIASILKSDSDNNDCTVHSGGVDGVTWTVNATGENGAQCDTSAELKTIAGAIDVYLRAQNMSVCGVHCIRLTHGGTYSGYVTLAAPNMNPNTFYCGSAYTFGQCGSGGGADNHN